MEKIDWQKWASAVICLGAASFGVFVAVKYLLGIFLPFIIAWTVALTTAPGAAWVAKNTGIPRKICSIVLLVAILAIIVMPMIGLVGVLADEIRRLISDLSADRGGVADMLAKLFGAFDRISERIPIINDLENREEMSEFGEKLDGIISDALGRLLGEISAFLPSAAIDIIGRLPRVLIVVGVTIISCVYFCLDSESIHKSIRTLLPRRVNEALPRLKEKVFSVILRWIRAYLLLFFLGFVQLYFGFLILNVNYALLLSLAVAAVDVLPVLGTGTVLIPWGAFSLLTGDIRRGIGLFIIYAIITVVRQISEPKIIGQSLGIHPLLTLASMYGGLRLAGVWGMLLFPIALVIIKSLMTSDKEEESRAKK